MKKPWAHNPKIVTSRTHIKNPNKGPRFLNQVRTLYNDTRHSRAGVDQVRRREWHDSRVGKSTVHASLQG